MSTVYNTVPPGDGLLDFYGWGRLADGPTIARWFNAFASAYGDLGFQDRLSVSGTTGVATFTFAFAERGPVDDLPTINYSISKAFNEDNPTLFHGSTPRPAKNPDETYAELTERWLRAAYDALRALDEQAESGFNFTEEYPFSSPEATASDAASGPTPGNQLPYPVALASWRDLQEGATEWGGSPTGAISWASGLATSKGLALAAASDPLPDLDQAYVAIQFKVKDWSNAADLIALGATRDAPVVMLKPAAELTAIPPYSAWVEAVTYFGELTDDQRATIVANPV